MPKKKPRKVLTQLIKLIQRNKTLFIILILAFGLRFVGLVPNVLHPDESPLQDFSKQLLLNILTKGDFDPHTFKYGSLMYYIHALFYLPVVGVSYFLNVLNTLVSSGFASRPLPFESFFIENIAKYDYQLLWIGRSITALLGGASVYVLYLIGKKLFNEKTGLMASFLLAISPLHVRDSHYITTDVPSLFFILVSFLFLVYLVHEGKWKWYILSGLFIGISSTVRYFPVAVLAYPIAVILAFEKQKSWLAKIFVGLIFIFIGVFIGLPFLFLRASGPSLFMKDLEQYAFPWYSTSISTFAFSIINFVSSGGKATIPGIATLLPSKFIPFYASFVFFNAFGILPTLFSLFGIVLVLRKFLKKFLLLVVIPLITFVYSSFYIPAVYERLILPTIPFLAIFASCLIWSLRSKLNQIFGESKGRLAFFIVVALVLCSPLKKSTLSSWSCSRESIHDQGRAFIEKNIPLDARIAHLPMVSFPATKEFGQLKLMELFPNKVLSMEEVAENGYDYTFINAQRLDYETYKYFNDFFTVPGIIYKNSYLYLAMLEYQTRGEFLGEISKSWMCEEARLFFYKLPSRPEAPEKLIRSFDFDNSAQKKDWFLIEYMPRGIKRNILGEDSEEFLIYSTGAEKLTPPRLMSKPFKIKAGKVYSFLADLKVTADEIDGRDVDRKVFLRIDFYNEDGLLQKYVAKARSLMRLVSEGPTAIYFENEMNLAIKYNDFYLPGDRVALSPRRVPRNDWEKMSIIAAAPEDATYAVFSIQADKISDDFTFYVDNIEFFESAL